MVERQFRDVSLWIMSYWQLGYGCVCPGNCAAAGPMRGQPPVEYRADGEYDCVQGCHLSLPSRL